eukprot:3029862-Pyramimonas_sp.AAC.1
MPGNCGRAQTAEALARLADLLRPRWGRMCRLSRSSRHPPPPRGGTLREPNDPASVQEDKQNAEG